MKWIKLESELPEQETPVLLYIESAGRMQILMGAYFEDEHGSVWYDYQTEEDFEEEPLFWQHLPDEPKEDLLSIHSVVESLPCKPKMDYAEWLKSESITDNNCGSFDDENGNLMTAHQVLKKHKEYLAK